MPKTADSQRIVVSLLVAILVAGTCAGAKTLAATAGAKKGVVHARTASKLRGLLYVGASINAPGDVAVYRQGDAHHRQAGEIKQGIDEAFGLFVDAQRNVYIANLAGGNVTVYAHGSKTPFETLTGLSAPEQVVVAPDGTVYVSDMGTINMQHTGAAVYEFAPGATMPTRVVGTFSSGDFPLGLGLDASNNLYVGVNVPYGPNYTGHVLEFAPGSSSGRDLGIRVNQGGGLAIDRGGNIVLVEEGANAVDIFAPGSTHHTKQIKFSNSCCIYNLSLDRANDVLWVTGGFWGFIYGVSYPDGAPVETISAPIGSTWGIATSPAGSP